MTFREWENKNEIGGVSFWGCWHAAQLAMQERAELAASPPELEPKHGDDPIANAYWGGRTAAKREIHNLTPE